MSSNLILIIFIGIPILLAQATWIFIDARKRGEKYYWLWGLLGLVSIPGSLIIYLIVMGISHERCSHCEKEIKKGGKSCPYCGNLLRESCPNCGANIESDWEYCPECNIKLKQE